MVRLGPWAERAIGGFWIGWVVAACLAAAGLLIDFIGRTLHWGDILTAFGLSLAILTRVVVLMVRLGVACPRSAQLSRPTDTRSPLTYQTSRINGAHPC